MAEHGGSNGTDEFVPYLRRYAENLNKYPGERKYRRLKMSNKVFAANVWPFTAAREMLAATGWSSDVKEGWLILADDHQSGAALTAAVDAYSPGGGGGGGGGGCVGGCVASGDRETMPRTLFQLLTPLETPLTRSGGVPL